MWTKLNYPLYNLQRGEVVKLHLENSRAKVKFVSISLDIGGMDKNVYGGVDPGQVNSGLAIISPMEGIASLYQIECPSSADGIERIEQTTSVMRTLLQLSAKPNYAIVEAAAHNALYGQANLAEARTAAIAALMVERVEHIRLLPPKTIRKHVFGNGNQKAEEWWPELPKDAASAFACALSCMKGLHEMEAR